MNRQERARVIASLTDDEIRQLRERISDSDAHDAADRRFARNLFSGSDADGDDQDLDDDEYTEEQRQWAKDLFATLGDDNDDGLAGLKSGRTIGRTTSPTRDPTPHNEFRFS